MAEGDRLTVRADTQYRKTFSLFTPDIDDYRLGNAESVASGYLPYGKTEFTLTSPFTGLGTLRSFTTADCCGPVSFTITIAHGTNLLLSHAPRRVKRGHRFTIRAHVQSPAGVPVGACLFQPISGHGVHPRGPVPLVGGACAAKVRAGNGHRARYRVTFEGADGWQDTSARTRRITVRRRAS